LRRPLNLEYVQQQTIANKKRLEEKDPAARARNNDALRKMAADPAAHRAYLMRASLIDSVRKRTEAAARGTGAHEGRPYGHRGSNRRGGTAGRGDP
jgi:3-(3-hydroxy-phenyl)propionate hydroxylase